MSRASVVQFHTSRYIIPPNRASKGKIMTIEIYRELLLFNFEHLDILRPWIGHQCENSWPFEFIKSFCCSILSLSIYYVHESGIRVKSHDHLNFSRPYVVQFWASRYIMSPTQTSEWKVMTIWISREVPLFNFERLGTLCPKIRNPCEKLWTFEFHKRFRCLISSVSIYYVWKSDIHVKSYDQSNLSRASLFNFERLDILYRRIGHPRQKSWPLEFLKSFCCSISSMSICYVPASVISVKIHDHLNLSSASVFQFWASRYIMSTN